MSQALNHVNWCLNKAKKEGEKHRGLVQIQSNLDLAKHGYQSRNQEKAWKNL